MFDIDKNDILAKVTRYTLDREDIHININVAEVVAGKSTKKFQAYPVGSVAIPNKYYGFGGTETEALRECLQKIKHVDSETLMEILDPSLV